MKILVTGGAGYIGSMLVPLLINEGHQVSVIDNFMYGQTPFLNIDLGKSLTLIKGDVRDWGLMTQFVAESMPDVIIPLACFTGAPLCEQWPQEAKEVIVESLQMLCNMRRPHQKIIYPTTNSGYGVGEEGIYCTEESPLRPVSHYGRLKVEAERRVLESGNAITLRLATVFGLSPRMRLDLLVNDFVFQAVTTGNIKGGVFESHFKRNFIHIRDVTQVFMHCLAQWETMQNNVYNVGLSSANISKWELCVMIKRHISSFTFFEGEGRDPDQRNYVVSNEKLKCAGFIPRYSLDDGILELIEGFKMIKGREQLVKFSNV